MGKVFTFVMPLLSPITSPPPSYLSCSLRWYSARSYHVSCSVIMVDCRGTLLFVRGSDTLDLGSFISLCCLLYCMITSSSYHPHMCSLLSFVLVILHDYSVFAQHQRFSSCSPYVLDDEPMTIVRASVIPHSCLAALRLSSDLLSVRTSDLLHCQ